jgi:Ca2+-binding RTX toxin-like protein
VPNFSSISSRITTPGTATGDPFNVAVINAVKAIYEGSTQAAADIDAWLASHPGQDIEIRPDTNNAHADPGATGSGRLYIDLAWIINNLYISDKGIVVADTVESGLAHELSHAVTGLRDNDSFLNLNGQNIDNVNNWYPQLSIAKQVTYESYDVGGSWVYAGQSYTANNSIANAIIDRGTIYHNPASGLTFNTYVLDLKAAGVAGAALIIGGVSDNNYVGTVSSDWLYGNGGIDVLNGDDGNDFIYGGAGGDDLKGGAGRDEIWGGDNPLLPSGQADGDDTINGGAGRDTIYGGDGSDTIVGGADNDQIWGGGKGVETNSVGDVDTADYSAEVTPATISFNGSGATPSIVVSGAGGGTDTLHSIEKIVGTTGRDLVKIAGTIVAGVDLTIDGNGGQGADARNTINFSKGTTGGQVTIDGAGTGTITLGTGHINLINFHTAMVGSEFDDVIEDASTGGKEIDAGAGDDVISLEGTDGTGHLIGGAGNDTITGGDGNDVIYGGASNAWDGNYSHYTFGNMLYGGDGSDQIFSESEFDHIFGGDGSDYIQITKGITNTTYGDTFIDGGGGNDLIDITRATNWSSSTGVTLILSPDSGHDTLLEVIADPSTIWTDPHQSVDIQLDGIDVSDITLIWNVTGDVSGNTSYAARGDLAIVDNVSGASILIKNVYGDDYSGNAGRWNFYGFTINHLQSAYYVDTVADSGVYGPIDLSSGDTSAYEVAEADVADGTALPPGSTTGTSGNDDLAGGTGDDSLLGGDGDDLITGSGGNDQVDGGDGVDTLELFGSRADFAVSQLSGGETEISDSRGILGIQTLTGVEFVYFVTDGKTYAMSDFLPRYGTSGADVLNGTSVDNEIHGLDGDDVINGNGGSDVIDGGDGADIVQIDDALSSYAFQYHFWDNTYHLLGTDALGDSVEISLANIETVQFLQDGLVLDMTNHLVVGTSGDDLMGSGPGGFTIQGLDGDDTITPGTDGSVIDGGAGDDLVILEGSRSDYQIGRGEDGTIEISGNGGLSVEGYVSASNVEALYFVADDTSLAVTSLPDLGTSGNDTLTGTGYSDMLYGDDGDDTLNGLGGDDALDGGAGADTMVGGAGDDFYVVDDAGDVITELGGDGYDNVESSVSFTLPSNVEELSLNWTPEAIEAIGNDLDNSLWGNGEDNLIVGGNGDDYLWGDAGNDTLDGGVGSDTYGFWRGQGQDVIVNETRGSGIVNAIALISTRENDVYVTTANDDQDIVIGFYASDDTITITGMNLDSAVGIDEIRFDDATWSYADIMDHLSFARASAPAEEAQAGEIVMAGEKFFDHWSEKGQLIQVARPLSGDIEELRGLSPAKLDGLFERAHAFEDDAVDMLAWTIVSQGMDAFTAPGALHGVL